MLCTKADIQVEYLKIRGTWHPVSIWIHRAEWNLIGEEFKILLEKQALNSINQNKSDKMR